MCVLDPVLSCCCYAVRGMTDSIFLFFPVLLQRVGYTRMFVAPWLISLIGDILVYIFAPNSSCDFLYCTVLVVLMLFVYYKHLFRTTVNITSSGKKSWIYLHIIASRWGLEFQILSVPTHSKTSLSVYILRNQPTIALGYNSLSSVVKRPEREPGHSLPSSAVINNKWSHTSMLSYIFMVCVEITLPFYCCNGYAWDVCSKYHHIYLKRKKILYSYFFRLLHLLLLSEERRPTRSNN